MQEDKCMILSIGGFHNFQKSWDTMRYWLLENEKGSNGKLLLNKLTSLGSAFVSMGL